MSVVAGFFFERVVHEILWCDFYIVHIVAARHQHELGIAW